MLLWTTQWLGLLNELYSRPVITADKKSYNWPVGPLGFVKDVNYRDDPNALYLISSTDWETTRPIRDGNETRLATSAEDVAAHRFSTFAMRQVPYVVGCFPFMTYVVCIVYHLEYSKWEVHENSNGALQIPEWVNALLYGTILIFASFAFVMPVYQSLPPSFYFGSEIVYMVLSLTAKMFLGIVILTNVLMGAQRAEDVLGAGAAI